MIVEAISVKSRNILDDHENWRYRSK